jgi:hypothetical protein
MGLAMVIQTVMERRVPQRILQDMRHQERVPVRMVATDLLSLSLFIVGKRFCSLKEMKL